jgi:para-nitrobenzyl esterase
MSEAVETSSGRVRGSAEAGVLAFKGIPYARPPVGARRFEPPQPVPPRPGARDAVAFGPQAWQVIFPFFDPAFDADPNWCEARSYHRGAITTPVPNDEDCLVFNVWTPSASRPRSPSAPPSSSPPRRLLWRARGRVKNHSSAI